MINWLRSLPHQQSTYEQGRHLFRRDDPVQNMFLIESGAVQLIRAHRGGGALVLQRASAGSILAEASLFTTSYHCDAITTELVRATLIARRALRKLFLSNPEFAQAWAIHLSGEVRNARRRAEILSLRTVAERLDAWIAEHGRLPDKGGWRGVALEIGASPEALYREIARRRK
ncbi:MAG: Crp/Fnr family transcriptional regulator [Hyphomonadaceae bacterium]|nr:Crp/Fnr family transcriptional regulator [Hyphomonadaceae bacterium]